MNWQVICNLLVIEFEPIAGLLCSGINVKASQGFTVWNWNEFFNGNKVICNFFMMNLNSGRAAVPRCKRQSVLRFNSSTRKKKHLIAYQFLFFSNHFSLMFCGLFFFLSKQGKLRLFVVFSGGPSIYQLFVAVSKNLVLVIFLGFSIWLSYL